MRPTKEEANKIRQELREHSDSLPAGLYIDLSDLLFRLTRSLPSQAAVERDRQRGKKRRSAAQTS